MSTLHLKPGREKSLLRRHPWVFSGAIARFEGEAQPGETVCIAAAEGTPLALGAYSPHSQITARVWSFDPGSRVDAGFLRARLEQAIQGRRQLPSLQTTTACRLVNAESDGLPGVIVDQYGDFLVCQFLSAGAEMHRGELVASLRELVPCAGIYERSEAAVRAKEGLEPRAGLLWGEEPPPLVEIEEGGCRFLAEVCTGHKTGFYLDQRENRRLLVQYAAGKEVLNCFAYTGAFGIWALRGGAAKVSNVDESAAALELGSRHVELNGLETAKLESVEGDVFKVLRQFRDRRRSFDLIVLDPPKFAESQHQLERACRGYKDINLLAFKLLRPGGVLFTFSCSGQVGPDLFQKVVADAALDAGREAQILQRLGQAPDHPVLLSFPEAGYLKGLVCRVGE
ncbi:MAG: class I SAM-dependent methyltransferase [Candidatus Latescibacteria bacterium]|nr:class I SAM-dependent methyltransferase [Candidatus Latescibacterota bacterium]